jgi:rRNA maturation protein Nop10
VHGKAIRIEGGDYTLKDACTCPKCGDRWSSEGSGGEGEPGV